MNIVKCNCDFCKVIIPSLKRAKKYLNQNDFRDLEEFVQFLDERYDKQIRVNAPVALLKIVLNEATGNAENPKKRIWPLHTKTYRAIHSYLKNIDQLPNID